MTGRAHYVGTDDCLYEYNVDAKVNAKTETGHKVDSTAPSCGIGMGVECVFRSLDDGKEIYALMMDNSVEYVSDGVGTTYGFFTNAFPLSSDTTDLSKALYSIDVKFIYKNRKVKLKPLVCFDNFYTIIRLYKDIFLAYGYLPDSEEKNKILVFNSYSDTVIN